MSSLYLHIPFCEKKCVYCDFYSIENLNSIDRFVAALKREIVMYAALGASDSFETIFFGGGTPSLLAPAVIADILRLLKSTYHVTPDAEITMEANPGTVDQAKLSGYREAGVNRMSFGVQSFFEEDLAFLGRIHNAQDASDAIRDARSAGFANLNVDMIYALPGQTPARWNENMQRAVNLGTEHLSAYSLIVEDGTPLARMVRAKTVSPLPVDMEADMYEQTMRFFAAHGFEHYEVSNYAKPGFASRHNCNYWNHANYLSFGPSAHSFHGGRRWWNIANISTYLNDLDAGKLPIAGEETLTQPEMLDEAVMLGLRSGGIDLDRIKTTFGINLYEPESPSLVNELIREQLAVVKNQKFTLTEKGFLLCEEISERILSSLAA